MRYKKELKEFRKFKKDYQFKEMPIVKKGEKIYCDGIIVKDENGYIGESEKWINVSYSLKGTYSRLLSNLFPYTFKFKGYRLHSIESFFQAIKFPDIKMQKQIFKYSGREALALKETTNYDWQKDGFIYFKGKKIKRDSLEYDLLIDELYISAIQNRFYRKAIKNCPLPIIHVIGKESKKETVFTRYEFEFMLNCLHDFLVEIEKNREEIYGYKDRK